MRIICVDGDMGSLNLVERACGKLHDVTSCDKFTSLEDALEYAKNNGTDLAIVSMEWPKMGGLEFGQRLKELYPQIMLVYVSDSIELLAKAILMNADYYMLKPMRSSDLEHMLHRMSLLYKGQIGILHARMLGRFEMYYMGEVIHFSNAKAKELLALCLDHRGGEVSMEEAIDKLWPNREYDEKVKKLYRKASMCLAHVMKAYGIEKFYIKNRASSYIDTALVDCDYYTYLSENHNDRYQGEYLFDYEWAEETLAKLVWSA